ncbi:hypothetical protein H3V53_34190 [Paraburkholderia bengalensis]|uniref:Uncharacterized protein n=1 Tax=Paraburkholderia bengalensis TaxID=2747562 RepID=A0ABU8J2W1_9BURK
MQHLFDDQSRATVEITTTRSSERVNQIEDFISLVPTKPRTIGASLRRIITGNCDPAVVLIVEV